MRRKLFTLLLCVSAMIAMNLGSQAQTKLIHYWNFNTFTATIHLPSVAVLPADYTNIGSPTATLVYMPITPPGVSSAYLGYCDGGAAATKDFDTVNAQFGAPAGNYFRARNPNDSMELLLYIPTTHYQNITLRYGSETSSLTSGDSAQIYSYSVDSGLTWKTSGLSATSLVLNTVTWDTFRAAVVSIQDPLANNNPKLVFKITFVGRDTGTSGNNRFDNITVSGDTIVPTGTLMHFWDFNSFTGVQHNPNFIPIGADYSIHDTSKIKILYSLFPGTSLSNPTYFDFGTAAGTDFDTVNQNWPAVPALGTVPAGNWVRMRNPDDSSYLNIYMPTVNYKNIILKYATQTSSLGNGDSIQTFTYSVDSGLTWRISGISEVIDSPWLAGMPVDPATIPYRSTPVTIKFTDPAANNASKLVFRIHLLGRNTGLSGNNRFDNFSVQGDSILSPTATITTTAAPYGPFCNTVANPISVGFTTTGAMGTTYAVQITNQNGTFPTNTTSNIIGTGTTSPISATIPSGTTPGTVYRVRVVNSYPGIYGSDNGSNITLSGVAGPITGSSTVCVGATTALSESGSGTWTSSITSVATVGSTGILSGLSQGTSAITYSVGVGCTTSTTITVNPVPAIITGTPNTCIATSTTLSDATALGAWSTSATTVATVGSGSGVVTGVTAGTVTISYSLTSTGCFNTQSVIVNPLPSPISGTTVLCALANTTLSDAGGGTWSSSNTGLAIVGSGSGIVTGEAGGNPVITYKLPTGCISTVTLTVNSLPAPINGANGCAGVSSIFTDSTAFGAWSSSNPSVATIGSSTGVVNGIALGTTTITYKLSTGCLITLVDTVNSVPSSITGSTFVVCAGGSNITLSDATVPGSWSSSNTYSATVNSLGVVTGVAAGNPVITYTLPTGCIAVKTITVNPLPVPITGATSVYCIGSTTTLSDGSAGGTWTSDNTAVATVGSGSGFVTGISAGIANITYKLNTGCLTSIPENISSSPAPISGSDLCQGHSTNFTDATAFGAWSSSNGSVATVGSGTGVVTGVTPGTTTITYELSGACLTSTTVTVNPPPSPIAGTMNVCLGLTTTLSDAGGGTWSSSIPVIASVGSGSGMVTGLIASTVNITYTLPTGCTTSSTFTVNPLPVISGTTTVCIGSTSNLNGNIGSGTWTSSNTSVATVDPTLGVVSGLTLGTSIITYTVPTGCQMTTLITVISLPAAITGVNQLCAGLSATLSDAGGGGWYSGNPSVATIGFGTGVMTAVTAGTTTITYSLGTSCNSYSTVTVNPLPQLISGITPVCQSSTITLSDASLGGTWISGNSAVATIDPSAGTVTGISAGTSMITYTLPTTCIMTANITVNPIVPITGTSSVCVGLTTVLSDTVLGGTWTSSNTSMATVDPSTGLVTGVSAGNPDIMYTLSTGCNASVTLTVNPLSAILGTNFVCEGNATILSDLTPGGTWMSSNMSISTVGTTGIVTGIGGGVDTISYILSTGCTASTTFTVNPVTSIIGITKVCSGLADTLSDATLGGSWTSSNSSIAAIDPALGIMTGMLAGTATITYQLPTGCRTMTTATVNLTPTIYTVFGGGNYCSFDTGVHVGLSGSNTGIDYQLYLGPLLVSTPYAGIDAALDFGLRTAAGTYTAVATDPATGCSAKMSSFAVVNIIPAVTPSVNVSESTRDTICLGIQTTFTANTVNGGPTPVYQWWVNGVLSGMDSINYSYYPVNGDVITAKLVSDAVCASVDTVMSSVTMTVDSNRTPSVGISASAGDTICSGTSEVFTAVPVFGGTAPVYTWYNNGVVVSGTSVYGSVPGDSNLIVVVMHSNIACSLADSVTASIRMRVFPTFIPNVSIVANPGASISKGQSVTFTATALDAGPNPSYHWFKNGIPITGATTSTYTSATLANKDSVTCVVKGTGLCGENSFNSVIMAVSTAGVQTISAAGSDITLVPNPNTGSFTVKGSLGVTADQEVSMEITDLLGQVVYRSKVIAQGGNLNQQVQLNNLANGVYVLNLLSGGEHQVFRFVIGQ